MRAAVIALVVVNLLLLALGFFGRSTGAGPAAPEINADRIKVLSPNEARDRMQADGLRGCLDWGVFAASDVQRTEQVLEGLGVKAVERRGDGAANWWVFIAPQANRRAADAVAEFLRRSGVADYYVVTDDPKFNNAVSLGVFPGEPAAGARREQMIRLGLRDVVVQERAANSGRVTLRLRDVPAGAFERLMALRTEYPGIELRGCEG